MNQETTHSSAIVRFFATLFRWIHKVLDWLTPLVALFARCWVGYVFLKSGLLKLANWQSTVFLFTYEFHVPLLSPAVAAFLGTTAEIVLPILIILGLGGRFVIALLFAFNAVAVISYPHLLTPDGLEGLIQHINWGVILGLLMCYGSSSWTLDRVIIMIFCRKKKQEPVE